MWYAVQIVDAVYAVDRDIALNEPVGIYENIVLFEGDNVATVTAIATDDALESDLAINDHSAPGSFFKRDWYDVAQHFVGIRSIVELGSAMPEDGAIVGASKFELDGVDDISRYLCGGELELNYYGTSPAGVA